MAMPMVGPHDEVRSSPHQHLPTTSSAVCRCGAVYDNGNLSVPLQHAGLCGRCANLHAAAGPPLTPARVGR